MTLVPKITGKIIILNISPIKFLRNFPIRNFFSILIILRPLLNLSNRSLKLKTIFTKFSFTSTRPSFTTYMLHLLWLLLWLLFSISNLRQSQGLLLLMLSTLHTIILRVVFLKHTHISFPAINVLIVVDHIDI